MRKLTSEHGFYIGEPSGVMIKGIINQCRNSKGEMEQGVYSFDDKRFIIVNSTKGNHNGIMSHSGKIAVIPLELVDGNKLDMLDKDTYHYIEQHTTNVMRTSTHLHVAVDYNQFMTVYTKGTNKDRILIQQGFQIDRNVLKDNAEVVGSELGAEELNGEKYNLKQSNKVERNVSVQKILEQKEQPQAGSYLNFKAADAKKRADLYNANRQSAEKHVDLIENTPSQGGTDEP